MKTTYKYLETREYEKIAKEITITPDIKGKKLHLGSGYYNLKGFVNLDKSPEVKPDVVADIEKGIPFPNNFFSHIFSSNVLEHIRPCKFRFVLEEIYRVSKNGCILELILPFDNMANRINYDHYRTFNWNSFYPAEIDSDANYYTNFKVKRLEDDRPNKFLRFFIYLFPMLRSNVYLKFKVIKEEGR